jgi:glycosyltransferase involved in cell wall biosynthesis
MTAQDRGVLRLVVIAPPHYEIPPAFYGGAERICYLLVEGLIDRGHDVTLVATGPNHTRARFIRTLEQPCGEGTDADILNATIHVARALAALDQIPADVVHDHTLIGPLTGRYRAAPTVVTAHLPVAGPESQRDYLEVIGGWCSLVALTDAQRRHAPHLNWAGTVHNGISLQQHPFRAQKDDYVLYMGRVSRTKGIHTAIDAARAAGMRLVIAGKGTIVPEMTYFETEISPRLGGGVEWVGEVGGDQKHDLLARAQCLLFPVQWEEPFGLVLLEAMACGTPVVALRAGSVPEVVADGVSGFVCDEAAELPEAIGKAAALDPRACRDHVARHFTAERMVAGYEALYMRVLERSRPLG